jgi:hypothetical protein
VLLGSHPLLIVGAIAGAIGAYGIANSQRWGYLLAVASSGLEVALLVLLPLLVFGLDELFDIGFLIFILFPIALFCLLLHPESREHQRIWFD